MCLRRSYFRLTSDCGGRVAEQQPCQCRTTRSLHVVYQGCSVVLGFRGSVQIKDVNGPWPVRGIVGLKMLQMPCHRTVAAFLLRWPLGHQPSGMQGGELGIGPNFNGFCFVLLEEGTIALPPVLVVRGDRSLQSIPPHARFWSSAGSVPRFPEHRSPDGPVQFTRSEGVGRGRTAVGQVFQEVREVRHSRTLAFQS